MGKGGAADRFFFFLGEGVEDEGVVGNTSRNLCYETTSLYTTAVVLLLTDGAVFFLNILFGGAPLRGWPHLTTISMYSSQSTISLILLYKFFPLTKHWGTTFTLCTENNHI